MIEPSDFCKALSSHLFLHKSTHLGFNTLATIMGKFVKNTFPPVFH